MASNSASSRTEQGVSPRPTVGVDNSKGKASWAAVAGGVVKDLGQSLMGSVTQRPPGSVKQSPGHRERPDSTKRREGGTESGPSKVPRTSGDGDMGKGSKGGHGKVGEEDAGGVLLDTSELDESPQVSIVNVIFHKATNETIEYYRGDG